MPVMRETKIPKTKESKDIRREHDQMFKLKRSETTNYAASDSCHEEINSYFD
jgi:hypothetical protein